MSRHRTQVKARSSFDEAMQRILTGSTLTLDELKRRWPALKGLVNAQRLQHFLRLNGKKICPGCAEFLRRHGIQVDVQYVKSWREVINLHHTPNKCGAII